MKGLKAVIIEAHENGHLWGLGCESDILDQWYSRNQFQPTIENFLDPSEVPKDIEFSFRAAAKQESMGAGPGFLKCSCTGVCVTNDANVTKLVLNVTVVAITEENVQIKNDKLTSNLINSHLVLCSLLKVSMG